MGYNREKFISSEVDGLSVRRSGKVVVNGFNGSSRYLIIGNGGIIGC